MPEELYDDNFYKNRDQDTGYAATRILELLFSRLRIMPDSMIDIGCGVGTWLKTAREKYGVGKVIGVDGDYVPRKYLQIQESCFLSDDLETYCADKILEKEGKEKFDVALCLEVAEHIRRKHAEEFINKLCRLSDVVCFSAAVPRQGGNGHVNEQRLSYWTELFKENGYLLCDAIRPYIWNDKDIPIWYRNNTVIFYNHRETAGGLIETGDIAPVIDLVHPDMFESKLRLYEKKIRELQRDRNIKNMLKGELCRITEKLKSFR